MVYKNIFTEKRFIENNIAKSFFLKKQNNSARIKQFVNLVKTLHYKERNA